MFIVRTLEDHEIVHHVITKWAPGSNNKLEMKEKITKYDIFNEPEVIPSILAKRPIFCQNNMSGQVI